MTDHRKAIKSALAGFEGLPLPEAARRFLDALGYASDRTIPVSSPADFCTQFDPEGRLDHPSALKTDWKSIHLLFQLTDEELVRSATLFKDTSVNQGLLRSYLFFAVELTGRQYARSRLTSLTRQINRIFPMPVMVLIKHHNDGIPVLSIAVINRRPSKRDAAKDVLGKVTIIRDIAYGSPHRGHLDILDSFAFTNLIHPQRIPITNFDTLHAAWEEIFNVELLNKRFYEDLARWYFWALPQVQFPADLEPDEEKRNATSLIRLLTRLIFCWFLKEKQLIPEKLFNQAELNDILVDLDPDSCTYFQGILQNLFFATLNQRMGKDKTGNPFRAFAKDEGFLKNRKNHGVDNLYRYEEHFRMPHTVLAHFADVPFLNGGLFERLDPIDDETEKQRYLDGFTRKRDKRARVPNHLFFGEGELDISQVTGETRKGKVKALGLLRILHAYKFTIVENTPIDQEIALDPELLGKVFENLLASYNEETKTTARKQTGSFYTPRPIVEYMVDETLKAYLSGALVKTGMREKNAQAGLDILFAYTEKQHPFTDSEADTLLTAIHTCKILDPACGSGAFPMGMLQKLVYIIHKLDPDNSKWMQLQIEAAGQIPDSSARDAAIAAIERDFADNEDDYGRKLYLIENCLYGVDIQPIAIQISKLRFFISLVCDQRISRNKKENHGVRPLPNLETKFVAANTLIGLPEMDYTLLVNPRVHKIESEIETLYHSHFSIQRRDQKLALQRKIKDLRKELGRLLAESLMAPKKAQHIADWDPFNPQASSDFFDPHWMFGRSLGEGFDIVFGNPPWGAALSREIKEKLKDLYPDIDSSTPNSFAYFIGAALKLSKAHIAFVLPDAVLIKDYAKTRRILRDFVTRVDWYLNTGVPEQYRPFVYVEHDVCVLVVNTGATSPSCRVTKHMYDPSTKQSFIDEGVFPKEHFILPQHDYCFNLLITKASYQIMKALEEGAPLGDITQCHEGIHTGNIRDELFHRGKINAHCKPLFYGARAGDQIANYYSTTSGWFVDYRDSVIKKDDGQYASLRDERIFRLPKIYITRTGNPIKAFFDHDTYASNNFFSLQLRDYSANTETNLKALLPLILSSAANYYIRTFAAPRLGNTYVETKIIHLNRVPVSPKLLEASATFALLTDLIIMAIRAEKQVAATFLEDMVDACVMECYFRDHMAERNLLFLDDLAPHLDAYNPSAGETQQHGFLDQLYRTLNAPTSKIRNRLLRISADSPDLLAVIKAEGRL